jgi:hypothetical protein
MVSGLGPTFAALVVAVKKPDLGTQTSILRFGRAWLLGWLGLATFEARRAALTTLV